MLLDLPDYKAAKPEIWQGRKDTDNPERFFQKIAFLPNIQKINTIPSSTIFLGFASDAGIIRNQGRAGARFGPDHIKAQLAKLPSNKSVPYLDLGTIECNDGALERAQTQFATLINACHQQKHRTIALGGGHEIAWAHYQGLAPHYAKMGIINFDAHFDLRPHQPDQLGTSGTPFSQIAASCQKQKKTFNYCCIGIQQSGNTPSLFARANELKVQYLCAETLNEQSMAWKMAFIDDFLLNLDYIYLSVCLDVFAECFAPGVSAPQPLGVTPWQILPLLKYIMQSGKVVGLDIAELSPPLDHEQKTARLAALVLAELLNCY